MQLNELLYTNSLQFLVRICKELGFVAIGTQSTVWSDSMNIS